jgi:hypothetical protein
MLVLCQHCACKKPSAKTDGSSKDDDGATLIRVGFDHEPSQDEVETLMQQVSAPPTEVTDSGDFNLG